MAEKAGKLIKLTGARDGGKEVMLEFLHRMIEAVENGTPPFDKAEKAIMVTQCASDREDEAIYKITTSGMYCREELWLLEMAKGQILHG